MRLWFLLVVIGSMATSCSKGSHVTTVDVMSVKYACMYSDSVFKADRRIAICDSEIECNAICEKLPIP